MNILAVDIGNSNIVAGVFSAGGLKNVFRSNTSIKSFKIAINKYRNERVECVIVSSVVPSINKGISSLILKTFKIKPNFVTFAAFRGRFSTSLKNRSEIGADRLVNAFAAKILYGQPVIIIDFGTATTFCVVDKKGCYLGGAISTGVAISRDALHEKTAKLPLVELKFPKGIIGHDTVSSMQSGILWGYVGMVEKIVNLMKNRVGQKAKVIATGGLAKIIAGETDIINIVDQELTLKGLCLIGEKICKSKNRTSK